jgi:hypothetical protein
VGPARALLLEELNDGGDAATGQPDFPLYGSMARAKHFIRIRHAALS